MTHFLVHETDVLTHLATVEDCVFDALLCDPPYGLAFMGKRWDYDVPSVAVWAEALRVLKPGAPLIAFGGTRTYHRMVVNIEDAGFEIRDCIAWMYGSGFPKSLDVSKAIDATAGAERAVVGVKSDPRYLSPRSNSPNHMDRARDVGGGHGAESKAAQVTAPATPLAATWSGYGTALKPAMEPAVLARKPLDGTVANNITKWGVGALAIDACRIETTEDLNGGTYSGEKRGLHSPSLGLLNNWIGAFTQPDGRWPANVILDEEAGAALDAMSGERPGMSGGGKHRADYPGGMFGGIDSTVTARGDRGGASRFLYCAKSSREERDAGCSHLAPRTMREALDREPGSAGLTPRAGAGRTGVARNHHPTVKPVALTRYLATLLLPPPRAYGLPRRILVPYAGSGSEMVGAILAGWDLVEGIEREGEAGEDYVRRAIARCTAAVERPKLYDPDAEKDDGALPGQASLFGVGK